MMFIAYVDLYETVMDEETQELYQQVCQSNCTMPIDITLGELLTVSPMITNKGKFFKNVTKLTDRYGNSYKVVGNYKDIIKKKEDQPNNTIGYINYGKTTN